MPTWFRIVIVTAASWALFSAGLVLGNSYSTEEIGEVLLFAVAPAATLVGIGWVVLGIVRKKPCRSVDK